MITQTAAPNKEPDILGRLEVPMTPEAAESILNIRFSEQDVTRMHELLDKGNKGTITAEERDEADSYERVGHVIAMLQSVARRTLKVSTRD